jgi:hypothetical protein|tara:strand:+ start:147 stop:482 length:336 start_codon:yes stop_codon:yes gene_type:complete
MCFFGGGAKAAPAPKKPEFADAPPVVTGEQTGVDKPKNTAKATERLRMARKDKEIEAGTYNDPNLGRTEELLTKPKKGGKYTIKRDSTGRIKKIKTSTYRKSLRKKATKKQ